MFIVFFIFPHRRGTIRFLIVLNEFDVILGDHDHWCDFATSFSEALAYSSRLFENRTNINCHSLLQFNSYQIIVIDHVV